MDPCYLLHDPVVREMHTAIWTLHALKSRTPIEPLSAGNVHNAEGSVWPIPSKLRAVSLAPPRPHAIPINAVRLGLELRDTKHKRPTNRYRLSLRCDRMSELKTILRVFAFLLIYEHSPVPDPNEVRPTQL